MARTIFARTREDCEAGIGIPRKEEKWEMSAWRWAREVRRVRVGRLEDGEGKRWVVGFGEEDEGEECVCEWVEVVEEVRKGGGSSAGGCI